PTVGQDIPPAQTGEDGTQLAAAQAAALRQEAQTLAQNVAATGQTLQTGLQADVTRLTAQTHGEAAQPRSPLATAYAARHAALQPETSAAVAGIAQTKQQQRQTVTAAANAARQTLRTEQQGARTEATTFIENMKAGIIAAGGAQAGRARSAS